jgi:hypothetical protein
MPATLVSDFQWFLGVFTALICINASHNTNGSDQTEGNYFETATGAEGKTEFGFCSLFQERRQHCQDVKS